MANILVIHGPNLNMLGTRECTLYGKVTLEAINQMLQKRVKGHSLVCFQSNAEHAIVDKIQASLAEKVNFIIINPAAFTHTSIAIRDALLSVNLPFYEVHLSNIFARETFRHHSFLSDKAQGVICGLGPLGYVAAVDAILEKLS